MANNLYVFTDGGARGNPGPAAIGFLVKDKTGKVLVKTGKAIGRATNNVAEYRAVIEALLWISKNFLNFSHYLPTIYFYLDSQLIVNQLNGFYKIKDHKLRLLIIKVKSLEQQIQGKIFYRLISREKNSLADSLVNQTLDKNP